MNPVQTLQNYGQSIWLDYIHHNLLTSGKLQQMVELGEVWGVTSNPAIFQKAISDSTDYDGMLIALKRDQDRDATSLYEELAIADIQATADILQPVYERTNKRDGYVSLQASPYLAYNTQGTIQEARRLWQAVGRSNLMIKVPATPAAIPAIQQLLSEGININVTLLFSKEVYEQVVNAYITGLEGLLARGGDLSQVSSVASFFISRIDTAIDNIITNRLSDPKCQDRWLLESMLGQIAIANAKLVYLRYKQIFRSYRFQRLASRGAQTQRLLWASTSVKNPKYSGIRYVEKLIGSDTVNTIPPATLERYRNYGQPCISLIEDLEIANRMMLEMERTDIPFRQITDQLLVEGVHSFIDAFDQLLSEVKKRGGSGV